MNKTSKGKQPGGICFDCGRKYGTVPGYAIGVWKDTCAICGEKKACADASHDFQIFEFPKPSQQDLDKCPIDCEDCRKVQPPKSSDKSRAQKNTEIESEASLKNDWKNKYPINTFKGETRKELKCFIEGIESWAYNEGCKDTKTILAVEWAIKMKELRKKILSILK